MRCRHNPMIKNKLMTMTMMMILSMTLVVFGFLVSPVSAAQRKQQKEPLQQKELEECKPKVSDKVPLSECLATDLDFSDYQCMPTEPLPIPCINEHPECEHWASKGECKNNPQYMLLDCRKACHTCIPLHGLVEYNNVPQIAPDSETRKVVLERLRETQVYVNERARHSVEHLKTCRNLSSMCTYWSVVGECERRAAFMKEECSAACRTCPV